VSHFSVIYGFAGIIFCQKASGFIDYDPREDTERTADGNLYFSFVSFIDYDPREDTESQQSGHTDYLTPAFH
jgi:hypothetical protein